MTVYQADGQVLPVPLRDNLYAVRALRAAYPVRLVASDSAGRVVGIKTFESDLGGSRRVRPTPGVAWRKVTTASDAQRREWSLWVAPAVGGGSCYELRTPSGTVQSGCRPSPYAGSMLAVSITGRDGDQPLLAGVVGDAVTRVAVRYPDGTAITVRPVEGYMLAALDLTGTRRSGALQLQAFDKDGVPIAQAQIELRH